MLKKMLPMAFLMACCLNVAADEADIRKMMEAKLGTKVESVTKSGYLGLYEVFADGNIVYTDEKGTAFIVGPLIDGKTMKNVTEERMKKLTAIRFGDLPLDRAIKQVRGDGKRVLATFEDPNCGYCKRLAKELQKLDNITIYTFLLPILSEDSVRKSKQIWCSADRAGTWNDWMLDGKAPSGREDCDTSAVAKNQEFGRKLNISGTPTMFFANGERIPGAIPLARIEQKLNQAK
ncbi:MAG: DsbC family protein [Gammaproteobacteria bacterium]|nr:DsbC family protein [Gammaproteobacteria bacterium]MBU1602640.1 DsbC family protein [Gammaproteobacteria bacterium]MBU2433445.1 DsbC family protein [Gammaproteobacteria bacterium]MBU2451361.1 DsbC family protein [Gammaproteobacteria bacterium]